MSLDTEFVRAQFPAFSEASLAGYAHFDCAGGSYACAPVIDRLSRFYRARKVQPHGPSKPSRKGGAEMDAARTRLAGFLGVGGDEVHFGPSTTQNVYVLAQAFGQALRPGDAIIVTNQDHEANSGAWRRLAALGVEIREWQVDPETGRLDPGDLDALFDGRVRLLCFPHCSNVIGEINDVRAIVAKAHAEGAMTCVDGVSYVPHGVPDVATLGADIYLFSAYKTYGTHLGVMVVRRDLAEALPNQSHWFKGGDIHAKLTPAGPDHAQIAALAGFADYMDLVHAHHFGHVGAPVERARRVHDLFREHETALLKPLMKFLRKREGVRILGPGKAKRRAPTVAIETDRPGRAVAEALARHKIICDGGDFYAPRPLQAMGIDPGHGVFRASFVHYTTGDEVTRLIAALDEVL